jgi:hypothetical protein
MNSEPRGDGGDQEENQRREPVITEETVAAQPRSELGGLFKAAERQLRAVKGPFVHPPTIKEVASAHADLQRILKLPRHTGRGYKDPEFDHLFQYHLEGMKQFMWAYINLKSGFTGKWQAASLKTADNLEKRPALAKNLRIWTRAFIADRKDLPVNPYGAWNEAVIDKHPKIAQEIHTHLQNIGKYVKAMDLVNFMDTPEMWERSGLKKRLDLVTAQRWMKKLNYHWGYNPKGQYVDGHKRKDVVEYRQNVFLPCWANIKARTHDWSNGQPDPLPHERKILVWFHDESIFYANNQRLARWVHGDEAAKPYPKGEGASHMVADMVSADYRWLRCGRVPCHFGPFSQYYLVR